MSRKRQELRERRPSPNPLPEGEGRPDQKYDLKRFSLKRLLTVAAIWHLTIVFTIFLVGRRNASSLYRMRYAYFIMVIILGMKGMLSVFRPDVGQEGIDGVVQNTDCTFGLQGEV